ncbi:hypothetical protein A9Q91_03570 [Candidatus Gracilibacteria bacterium 28_42_T64]|nr:hypothetical protein A9Q91_03570 [Candidatus Gracilibacteria bacterium 28_42_T64]
MTEKKRNNINIKNKFGLLQKYKPLGLICITNKELRDSLIDGLKFLNAGFVVISDCSKNELISNNIVMTDKVDESIISGFDFVVSDDNIEKVSDFLGAGVAPIIIRENHLSNVLKEFNPMKNEGNAYFYDDSNHWSICYSVVRYMENYKFPFDNKNLVKNIVSA